MQIFFSSLQSLQTYTQTLDYLPESDTCQHCQKNNQWASHGFVYKQVSIQQREVAGKRILCSNRYGRKGCGRTRQLYLSGFVPQRQYALDKLIAFVVSLLIGCTVSKAYQQARNNFYKNTRHAWRWLHALHVQLGLFRSLWPQGASLEPAHLFHRFYPRSRRLNILLTTLRHMFETMSDRALVQNHLQARFF